MVDVSQLNLPRFPIVGTAPASTGWPTKFDTGPASIDGPYTPVPVAAPAPAPTIPAYAAANPLLANPAGGLPQAASPMNDPAALISQQLPPRVPLPNVVSALGAGVRTISQMGPPARPVTPASARGPVAKPAAAQVAPVQAAPAQARQPIDVISGGRYQGGGQQMSFREAQSLLAGAAPPLSAEQIAHHQILQISGGILHDDLQKIQDQAAAMVQAGVHPDHVQEFLRNKSGAAVTNYRNDIYRWLQLPIGQLQLDQANQQKPDGT